MGLDQKLVSWPVVKHVQRAWFRFEPISSGRVWSPSQNERINSYPVTPSPSLSPQIPVEHLVLSITPYLATPLNRVEYPINTTYSFCLALASRRIPHTTPKLVSLFVTRAHSINSPTRPSLACRSSPPPRVIRPAH